MGVAGTELSAQAGILLHKEHTMKSTAFDRCAAACAFLAGITTLAYAVAFVIVARSNPALGGMLSAIFLLLSGLLATVVFASVYARFQQIDPGAALWVLLLGGVGALGAAIHGGYDLANAINPPLLSADLSTAAANLPSQIDPRGLLTFGVTGLALFGFAYLAGRERSFAGGFRYLTWLLAALLVIIYLARLILLSPANPLLLGPVLLAGFVANPLWYIWLGVLLRREGRTDDSEATAQPDRYAWPAPARHPR